MSSAQNYTEIGQDMKQKDKRYSFILIVSLICILLDQLTKTIIIKNIPLYGGFSVIPGFFDIVHVQNYGAAFGFLNNPETDWQFWFFAAITVFMLGFVYNIIRKSPYDKYLFLGLALIIGGAIGNFIDRLFYRYVVDFLDFYIGNLHWPVFNVADICICLGTGLVILVYYFEAKQEKKNK